MSMPHSVADLAALLIKAHHDKAPITVPEALIPSNHLHAYVVQQVVLAHHDAGRPFFGGGWKVGAKSATASPQGAPLPRHWMHFGDEASVSHEDVPVHGLELEIAFSFNHDFKPRPEPYTEEEVLGSVARMGASIEILSSRLENWRAAPPLCQLADFQNHGSLIVGHPVEYSDSFDFAHPFMDFRLNNKKLFHGMGRNPVGDPRPLLVWLVNHCREHNLILHAGSVITTGSYTGLSVPDHGGTLTAEIIGFPAMTVELI